MCGGTRQDQARRGGEAEAEQAAPGDMHDEPAADDRHQSAASDGCQRPEGLADGQEGRSQRVHADEWIGDGHDGEIGCGHVLDLGRRSEQPGPADRPGQRQQAGAASHQGRQPRGDPGDAAGARVSASAEVAADHGEYRRAQTERQRILQVLEPHRGAEGRERRDAKGPGIGGQCRQCEVVEDRLQAHRRADTQDRAEQPAFRPDAGEGQRDRQASRSQVQGQHRGCRCP